MNLAALPVPPPAERRPGAAKKPFAADSADPGPAAETLPAAKTKCGPRQPRDISRLPANWAANWAATRRVVHPAAKPDRKMVP